MIAGYKAELAQLQSRNLDLEQTISNLRSDLSNYKKEHEVGIRLYESNVKDSGVTGLDGRSQASSFHPSSPDSAIKMVESSYRGTGDSNLRVTDSAGKMQQPSYGSTLRDSGMKQEASYGAKADQNQPFRSTFQSDDRGTYDSRYSGSSSQGGLGNPSTSRYESTSGAGSVSGRSGA